jgi:hypothetical protein
MPTVSMIRVLSLLMLILLNWENSAPLGNQAQLILLDQPIELHHPWTELTSRAEAHNHFKNGSLGHDRWGMRWRGQNLTNVCVHLYMWHTRPVKPTPMRAACKVTRVPVNQLSCAQRSMTDQCRPQYHRRLRRPAPVKVRECTNECWLRPVHPDHARETCKAMRESMTMTQLCGAQRSMTDQCRPQYHRWLRRPAPVKVRECTNECWLRSVHPDHACEMCKVMRESMI